MVNVGNRAVKLVLVALKGSTGIWVPFGISRTTRFLGALFKASSGANPAPEIVISDPGDADAGETTESCGVALLRIAIVTELEVAEPAVSESETTPIPSIAAGRTTFT